MAPQGRRSKWQSMNYKIPRPSNTVHGSSRGITSPEDRRDEAVVSSGRMWDSGFPVYLPRLPAVWYDDAEFEAWITSMSEGIMEESGSSEEETIVVVPQQSDSGDVQKSNGVTGSYANVAAADGPAGQRFVAALRSHAIPERSSEETQELKPDQMFTENGDVAYSTSGRSLVDLFFELEGDIDGDRLDVLLRNAWTTDSEATLKIIFQARSIHLGKGSREAFYKCCGWLAWEHPLTLLRNLEWLIRPVIPREKKEKREKAEAARKEDEQEKDDGFAVVDAVDNERAEVIQEAPENDWFIPNGSAHGYWKDLLNILALAACDELHVRMRPRRIFNVRFIDHEILYTDPVEARAERHRRRAAHHAHMVHKLEHDCFYRALHATVARLFAQQLAEDVTCLNDPTRCDRRNMSAAAKWAPTLGCQHDKLTFVATSIAEALHARADICPNVSVTDRTLYLKHARQALRRLTISPLRKFLEIVERDVASGKVHNIRYERVPSLAMQKYQTVFMQKDFERFDRYLADVAQGKAGISGAVLLPSTLVHQVFERSEPSGRGHKLRLAAEKARELQLKVVDGQWRTLVQRIKNSGTLQSAIAVCDTSGSMTGPRLQDGTCPRDSAIGLSLLLAEVVAPPFRGMFISFSERPRVHQINLRTGLSEKARQLDQTDWGMNTNFEAVFLDLILPIAVRHKLTQDEMVKQVFVFSDMQFDQSQNKANRWSTSFERIKQKYSDAGYEVPQLVFWNLAARHGGNPTPKPVTADEPGTALVGGYSQALLKIFMDNGQFEEPETDEEQLEMEVVAQEETPGEDREVVSVRKSRPTKKNPLDVAKRAISHKAYNMLKVVD